MYGAIIKFVLKQCLKVLEIQEGNLGFLEHYGLNDS
jgi:hypothetical protein